MFQWSNRNKYWLMTFLVVVIIMFLACNALSSTGSEDESVQETQNALLLT
jgi:hypothetical protein